MRQLSLLPVWNHELQQYAERIAWCRQNYLQQLTTVFAQVCTYFLDDLPVALRFECGWDARRALADVLLAEQEKDLRYGFTQSGSHRDDFQLIVRERIAKDYVSRGQLKLLVLALLLAQMQLFNQCSGQRACLLVDDLTAELDAVNRAKLVKYLTLLDCQIFVTSANLSDFGDLNSIDNKQMFHMKHGCVWQQ
jgi:DNA replication and repair protein RecF